MAKKMPRSVVEMIGEAVGDVADAASIAATGSPLGLLELAAEEEMRSIPDKKKRKTRVVRKKEMAAPKAKKTTKIKTKKNRGVKRSRR